MASFSTRRILKLEDQARLRYEETADARSQLKDLSARLVQAQETERRALSRELHDEVGQSLSAVLVELRNLSAGLGIRSAEQSRSHVETVKSLVESAVRVIRNMALLLRPSMLDDLGLIPALKWQARECAKRTSMNVSVATEVSTPTIFPDEYKTCVYRVVQEALAQLRTSLPRDHDPHPRGTEIRPLDAGHPGRRTGVRCPPDERSGLARHSRACGEARGQGERSLKTRRRNHPIVELPFSEEQPEYRNPWNRFASC